MISCSHPLTTGSVGVGSTVARAHVRLIALSNGTQIPPAVVQITGISEAMVRDGRPCYHLQPDGCM